MLGEDYVKTKVIGLTRGMSLQRIKLLILRATDSERCMPLMLSEEEFSSIAEVLKGSQKGEFELFNKVKQAFSLSIEHLEILCKQHGEHEVYVYVSEQESIRRLSISLPLAVSLSNYYNVALSVDKRTFERSALANETTDRMAFALGEMTDELLIDAEKSAVAEDNYELATLLRNEIRLRQMQKRGLLEE